MIWDPENQYTNRLHAIIIIYSVYLLAYTLYIYWLALRIMGKRATWPQSASLWQTARCQVDTAKWCECTAVSQADTKEREHVQPQPSVTSWDTFRSLCLRQRVGKFTRHLPSMLMGLVCTSISCVSRRTDPPVKPVCSPGGLPSCFGNCKCFHLCSLCLSLESMNLVRDLQPG